MIIINHDYKVVIYIHKFLIHHNVKLTILRLNTTIEPSLISEGVTEIRINSQPCNGINLITQHTRARRAAQVATVHDDYQRIEPDPPYSSAHLPRDITHWAIRGWHMHHPFYHIRGMVGYRPTQRPTKLVSLRDFIYPVCIST
jgi:hypothetical protein